jgi:hypothetical protein
VPLSIEFENLAKSIQNNDDEFGSIIFGLNISLKKKVCIFLS